MDLDPVGFEPNHQFQAKAEVTEQITSKQQSCPVTYDFLVKDLVKYAIVSQK